MTDWRIFTGTAAPHAAALPPPPPWRQFHDGAAGPAAKATFQPTREMVEAVNAALCLRRPLLLTGRPGSGKSSLIDAVARELSLGTVLRWHVTSRSNLTDALYQYDAIGRLHMQGLRGETPDIQPYLRLGPLGTALLPAARPRALLIDEIDKSDIDLPNDLLNVFERGEYNIPELARLGQKTVRVPVEGSDVPVPVTRGHVRCREYPFVVLTSNGERDFPAAFLRRCVRLRMPDPTPQLLAAIVEAHLGPQAATAGSALITDFVGRSQQSRAYATDQLMNAIYLVTGAGGPSGDDRDRLVELLFKQLTADEV